MIESEAGKKQVAQKAEELSVAINCLAMRIGVMEEALNNVLGPEYEEEIADPENVSELVPLARYLHMEKEKITWATCKLERLRNRIEL